MSRRAQVTVQCDQTLQLIAIIVTALIRFREWTRLEKALSALVALLVIGLVSTNLKST